MSLPFLYPNGCGPDTAAAATITLPANGGSIAIPFVMPGGLLTIPSVSVRTLDTTGTHTLEMVLYADGGEDGPAGRMQGSFNSFTYTASAAANRTAQLATPVNLSGTGCYWLLVRNASTVTTALAGFAAAALGVNIGGTATLAQSLAAGSILAATWAGTASIPLVRLNGGIFAMGGATL